VVERFAERNEFWRRSNRGIWRCRVISIERFHHAEVDPRPPDSLGLLFWLWLLSRLTGGRSFLGLGCAGASSRGLFPAGRLLTATGN